MCSKLKLALRKFVIRQKCNYNKKSLATGQYIHYTLPIEYGTPSWLVSRFPYAEGLQGKHIMEIMSVVKELIAVASH